jgi:hypothetical protein
MNDALKAPWPKLVLNLHLAATDDASTAEDRALLEVQVADGDVLASMSIPRQQLLQAVARKLTLFPLISPSGFVSITSNALTEILLLANLTLWVACEIAELVAHVKKCARKPRKTTVPRCQLAPDS